MEKHYFTFRIIFSFLFSSGWFISSADVCTTISDGLWSQPEIWSCGHPPGCGDTIFIEHYVEVDVNVDIDETPGCNTPTFIVITSTGTLHFQMGKKLSLACGSGISIEAGGQITADAYIGSNNFINICSDAVWIASDGPQSGPQVFGSGLPIELVNFTAYRNGDVVNLEWTTASETNNDYFTIERSQNATDFVPIVVTDGAGNSNMLINYFETDPAPMEGTSYYRLKQTDYDGNYSYSQTVAVKTYDQLSGELILYPNPTDQSFNLVLNGFGNEEILVVVRDITGKEAYSKIIVTSTDHHIEAMDVSNKLAAGTYIVTASSRNELYTQKLIVR